MMEQFKRRPGKDALTNLINSEHLLGKDPGNLSHMESVLKNARALDLPDVVRWMANILLEWQAKAAKPNKRLLLLLTDSYIYLEEYRLAIQACEMAQKLSPEDNDISDMLSDLSAKYTIKKGKYDQEGDFTKGIKDRARQEELIEKDSLFHTSSFLHQQAEKARADYLATPTAIGKINAFVDALMKLNTEEAENEAIEVLSRAHRDTGAYQFKSRIGDIRISQMNRQYYKLQKEGDEAATAEMAKRILDFELEEYTERVVNYPTDLNLKFELGRRLFLAGRYDEAIGNFQQAQHEPRRQLQAMHYLGQSFAKKGWLPEAAETLERALHTEMTENTMMAIRYTLGDVLEQMGKLQEAQEQFSKVAQVDFNFRDVRNRVDNIRKKIAEGGSSTSGGG